MPILPLTEVEIARFYAKTERRGACLIWTGACCDGYGRFKCGGKTRQSHRVAYALNVCEPVLQVLHTCDTPGCVEAAHLFEGTDADNQADRMGKARPGAGPGRRKLTNLEVEELRALADAGMSQRALAHRFGISQPGVGRLVRYEVRRLTHDHSL